MSRINGWIERGSRALCCAVLLCGAGFVAAESAEFCEAPPIEAAPVPDRAGMDFSCLVFIDALDLDGVDQIVDVSATPDMQTSLIPEAVKLRFDEIAHRRWLAGKRLLIVDEGYSVDALARLCHRSLQTPQRPGPPAMLLVGGLRAYAERFPLTDRDAQHRAVVLAPTKAAEVVGAGRTPVVRLAEFRDAQSGLIHWRAVAETFHAVDLGAAERFRPVLIMGDADDYDELLGHYPLPWWVYLVDGGEAAFQQHVERQRVAGAGNRARPQRCDLPF